MSGSVTYQERGAVSVACYATNPPLCSTVAIYVCMYCVYVLDFVRRGRRLAWVLLLLPELVVLVAHIAVVSIRHRSTSGSRTKVRMYVSDIHN